MQDTIALLAEAYVMQSKTIDLYHQSNNNDSCRATCDANDERLHDTLRNISMSIIALGCELHECPEIAFYWSYKYEETN